MNIEGEVIVAAANQLKEAFGSYAIVCIPEDKTTAPVVAFSGDEKILVGALHIARERIRDGKGNIDTQHSQRQGDHGSPGAAGGP